MSPELLHLIHFEKSVPRIFLIGFHKGWTGRHKSEKHDSYGKNVNILSSVWLQCMLFWSHVRNCSFVGSQQPTSFILFEASEWSLEAEICDSQIVLLINQQVVQLDIAMSNALLVHMSHS